jgi:hypothetical protein
MKQKNLAEYRKKYDISRHHAWAGTALLSVVLAVRIFILTGEGPKIPDIIFFPIVLVIIIYILISLIFTYNYRSSLTAEQERISSADVIEKHKIDADLEKARLKVEKKKAKGEVKRIKKSKN